MVRLDLYAKHYRNFFEFAQQKEEPPQEVAEEKVEIKNPFLNVEDIWVDIKSVILSDKFYALSLIGPQGKGKTVLSSIFATKADAENFKVVYALPEDFMDDFDGWINQIKLEAEVEQKTDKYCFVLDDLSYYLDSRSRKTQSIVKNIISRIRHEFEEKIDGKITAKPIFIIYISHRLHAVPPMLRNSGSFIFSSMQAADREDMIKLIARRKAMQDRLDNIYTFISKVSVEGPKNGGFYYKVKEQERFFKWGMENNPGDGRLMVSYHAGDLKIFQSQVIENMLDLISTRIQLDAPPPISDEEKLEIEKQQREEFKKEALELFPISTEIIKEKHTIPTNEEIESTLNSMNEVHINEQ